MTIKIPRAALQEPGAEPGPRTKGIPWMDDPIIMDRLNERVRLERLRIGRMQIMAMQKISADTFTADGHRLVEIYKLRAQKSVGVLIAERSRDLEDAIAIGLATAEDPSQDGHVRMLGLLRVQQSIKQFSDLHQLTAPLAGGGAPGDGSTTINATQNNTILGVSPADLLRLMREDWEKHEREMRAIDTSVEAERAYFGHDNIIPVGLAAGARDGEEADPDDDGDDDY